MLSRGNLAIIFSSLLTAALSTGCIIISDPNGGVGGAGVGGQGGGSTCVGADDGSGKTVASCDMMAITPVPVGAALKNCGASKDEAPPGYGLCKRGFEIYTQGAASTLQSCLAQIGVEPANACDMNQVTKCIGTMYTEICASQAATNACDAIATQICGKEPFDTSGCLVDVSPFNDMTLQELANCISATDPNQVTCQQAYNDCFAKIASF